MNTKSVMIQTLKIEVNMKNKNNIKKQFLIFLPIGCFTVFFDYCSYLFTLKFLNIHFAKAIGFLAGTFFSYFANKIITFKNYKKINESLIKFYILYFFTMFINVGINSSMNNYLYDFVHIFELSFIISTGCSAVSNFLGMKYYVFKNR